MKKKSLVRYTATPIRLKEYKGILQSEALKMDRSLNWLVVSMLEVHPLLTPYVKKKSQ